MKTMKTCNHENNVPSRLSPQWLCGNSCTWAHDLQLQIAGTKECSTSKARSVIV